MKKFIILIPLYNDWKSVSKLLNEIDFQVSNWEVEVSVIIVNDASTEKISGLDSNYNKIKLIKILNMKENRVHQRCIAAGLKYICKIFIPFFLNLIGNFLPWVICSFICLSN